jgi:hypothetical protein
VTRKSPVDFAVTDRERGTTRLRGDDRAARRGPMNQATIDDILHDNSGGTGCFGGYGRGEASIEDILSDNSGGTGCFGGYGRAGGGWASSGGAWETFASARGQQLLDMCE